MKAKLRSEKQNEEAKSKTEKREAKLRSEKRQVTLENNIEREEPKNALCIL